MESFRLDKQIALVTGGSRGIGLGIAHALAEAGSDIVLAARGQNQLKQAKENLSPTGCRVWTFAYDMNNVEGIGDFFARVVEETGGIDVLVNNAGGTRRGPAQALTAEDWNFVINLNMSSVFAMCQAFGKERINSGKKGKIINIASLMSETVREDNAAYAASKGGIRQLTKALAIEWAQYNIHVNAIGPGYIRTELTRSLWEDDAFDAWVNKRTPVGRWGAPEDLGNAAVFLATPASDYITGHILYVDGGFLSTMGPVF